MFGSGEWFPSLGLNQIELPWFYVRKQSVNTYHGGPNEAQLVALCGYQDNGYIKVGQGLLVAHVFVEGHEYIKFGGCSP